MKKLSIFFSLLFTLNYGVSAQYSMDFGISLGGANYVGETGGSDSSPKPWLLDMNLAKTDMGFGAFYRNNFTKNIAAKFAFNYARIQGADSLSGIKTQLARNLSFRTDILEMVLAAEYYFFTMNDLSRSSNARIDFGAYVTAGAGIAFYYPHAQLNDKWYSLRQLRTEGQESEYDTYTIVIPMGVGANFTFNKKFKVGIEFGYRFTTTDYLDDISGRYASEEQLPFEESILLANRTAEAFARGDASLDDLTLNDFGPGSRRGNPETNDGYFLGQITLSYNIASKNSFFKSKYNSVINRKRKRTKF